MPKFFVKNNQIKNELIEIQGEDVNHISNVLRLQKEDIITITDKETSNSYNTQILELSKEKVICQIIEKIQDTTESKVKVTIFQGLPKADKMELIIQKTTELGVNKIAPVFMKRCIVKLEGKDSIKKIERWRKIAEVASKQSGRDIIPTIENVENIKKVCEYIKDFDLFLVAYENEEENSLKNELTNFKAKITKGNEESIEYKIGILIGPEGGIDIDEINILKEAGAKIVSLGKRILRTETAPIAMLSNIIYELE